MQNSLLLKSLWYLPASNQNDDEFDKSKYYSLIVESYICKTGTVCGYVRKYGIRARDTFTSQFQFGTHQGFEISKTNFAVTNVSN